MSLLPAAYVVVKVHKRLWIRRSDSMELVYSPPDYIQVISRADLQVIADELSAGRRYIDAIMAFERSARIKSGYPGRSKQDRARRSLPATQ